MVLESRFITIGRILSPFGNRGEVKVQVLTDFSERFSKDAVVYVDGNTLTIESVRWHKRNAIVKLKSIDSISAAEKLSGKDIQIPKGDVKSLPTGSYYYFQLIGLKMRTTANESLGEVTAVLEGKGNDNFVVSGDKGEILIPAIDDVVKSIDLEKKEIVIEAVPGLLELNRKKAKS